MRTSGRLSAGIYVLLVVLLAVHVLAPQRSGPLALTAVFEPYLLLLVLPLLPFAIRQPEGRVAAVLIALLFVGRYATTLVSLPVDPAGMDLRVVSWNLQGDRTPAEAVVDRLTAAGGDVIVLQELSFAHAAAIESDPEVGRRYPHRVIRAEGRYEMALLSTLPIVAQEIATRPKTIQVTLDGGPSGQVIVIGVHPLPAGVALLGPFPVGLDATGRDADLGWIRARVDRALAEHLPVIVAGDLNTTERERGYDDVAHGLLDAHLEVGVGPGSSWRTALLRWAPFGLLRIDYVLSSPELVPVRFETDCGLAGSDHCPILATLRRSPPP